MSGIQRDRKHAQRLDWLRAEPALLARLPGVAEDVTPTQADALDAALRLMQMLRLYAPTHRPEVARWGIRLLVSELRGEHISGKDLRWATRGARQRAG